MDEPQATTISARTYLDRALEVATTAARTQVDAVEQAARAVAASIAAGGRLWAFGTGHSHMMAEEIYGRAGGLVDVGAILEPSLMLHEGLTKSSLLERQPGLADVVLATHDLRPGDCLVIASNSGRNAVPVELAVGARERGVVVIALTSLAHSRSVTSRAPGGQRLFEVADHVLDTCGVPGDAVLPHSPHAVGPTSTVVGALLLQALVVEVVAALGRQGIEAPTLLSLNVDERA